MKLKSHLSKFESGSEIIFAIRPVGLTGNGWSRIVVDIKEVTVNDDGKVDFAFNSAFNDLYIEELWDGNRKCFTRFHVELNSDDASKINRTAKTFSSIKKASKLEFDADIVEWFEELRDILKVKNVVILSDGLSLDWKVSSYKEGFEELLKRVEKAKS